MVEQLEQRNLLAGVPQLLPVTENFDDGLPTAEEGWEFYSSNRYGRIVEDGGIAWADSLENGEYVRNELRLSIDMEDSIEAVVTGFLHNSKDETHRSDRFKHTSDGTNWTYVTIPNGLFEVRVPKGTTQIVFRQYDNWGRPYDGRGYDDIQVVGIAPPPPPTPQVIGLGQSYTQSFDTLPGAAEGWEYHSTNDGRIRVVNGRLRADDSTRGGYSLNEAILHVSMPATGDAFITGRHWDLSDEEHSKDGIFITDNGNDWRKLEIKVGQFEYAIPASTTQIKFSQYDNYPAKTDGREWDDIVVEVRDYSQVIDWPDGLGYKADILINGGYKLSASGTAAPKALGWSYDTFWNNSFSTNRAYFDGSSSDLNGALLYPDGQERYVGVFYNGGSAGHGRYIGRQSVPAFVEQGGFYTGSCAGLFMALAYRYDLVPDLKAGSNSGISGWHTVTVDPTSSFAPYLQKYVPDLSMRVQHFYGPILKEKWTPPDVELIGTISRAASSIRHMNGTFMSTFSQQDGEGPVFLNVSHPEYGGSGPRLGWQMAALEMVRDHKDMVPDIKGNLVKGDIVTMTGVGQKVGDKQYHLFDVDVTGQDTLDVSLSGTTGNVDLYVQCGGLANERSYLGKSIQAGTANEQVTVAVPAGVTSCNIAAYGNHTVKNGAGYSLSVA